MTTKADYVRGQGQTRGHHCHWPGCTAQVPPAMWGCKSHWFDLPASLRARIWATYKPGQEVNGTPSAQYIEAAKAVQAWIADKGKAVERPGCGFPYCGGNSPECTGCGRALTPNVAGNRPAVAGPVEWRG